MSVVSSTDVHIFKRLANPDIADVELLPASNSRDAHRKATATMREAIDKAAGEQSAPAANAPQSALGAAMEQARAAKAAEGTAATTTPPAATPPAKTPPSSPKTRPPPPEEAPPSPPRPAARQEARPQARQEVREQARQETRQETRKETRQEDKEDGEDERMEKQGYLIELRRMQARGVELSRDFGDNNSLAELEFEVAKQNASISTENSVSFMRDMLRLVITGLEIGNTKLGPFLSIDGWADATTQDMHRYDHALERIHRRYFRKQQMSPIMEMGWLLIGSLGMWHFKSKFLGVTPTPRPEPTQAPRAQARDKRGTPPRASTGSVGGRPVLKAPGGLFGI